MTPDRWAQIQQVLFAVIECDPSDRERLMREQCGGDADLRREVETLLAAHQASGVMDRLADVMVPVASWTRAQAAGWEGRRVGQYRTLELLGAGGMGLVYKARDERLGRLVALKFLPPHRSTQPTAKERFLVEARAAAALDHPNICTILEIGETADGELFIAMPLYDGETLQARLTRGRLTFAEALPIALQMARGLGRAHERGIVHRDIKPSNVMLLADGTVKILDFGIATMDASGSDGLPFGTLAYMSPEHVEGASVDHRGDIWSLGVLVHEMLTGLRPFDGAEPAIVARAILTEPPALAATSHPDVPAAVDALLARALARRPDDRYPSMALLAFDLASLARARESGDGSPDGMRAASLTAVAAREAPSAGERRRAAVLVTSVSDYSVLVEQLAPLEVHGLVAQIRHAAVDVVRRHGGLVNQAIEEEIVSIFGVPAAHEDDELRAVRAAVELRARVRELAARAPSAPAVRIQSGIHVGPVVAQPLPDGPRRYAIVGAPARLASRLAAVASPDDVVVSAECQRLTAPFVRTAPHAPLMVESESAPVLSFRVTGDTGLETRLEASQQAGLTPYVGRHAELALLEAEIARARGGSGRMIAVVGDAGAGKSRLLHELRVRAAGVAGVRLLQGRCRAYGDVAPYWPFIELVRDGLGLRRPALDDARDIAGRLRGLDASIEPFIPLCLRLLCMPSASDPLPRHLHGEHLQAALLDALAAMMAVLAQQATLVVTLEDWHWADAASRAALERMSELVACHPLLFVVTTRPDRRIVDEAPARVRQVTLEPLDRTASTTIMRAVLHAEQIGDDLARRVFERTGGNPFFLEQVCCALLEQGLVTAPNGEAVIDDERGDVSLPDTVQAVIRTRLDNLEGQARAVLRVAAVIGREFDHRLLADVIEPSIDLPKALARLEAAGLIRPTRLVPDGTSCFTHVLTQEVSYDSLIAHQRKALHDRVGRAIERHHADRIDEKAALLAHHFGHAEAWAEAVAYGRRAADRASALSQFADALATLDRVLEQLPHLPDVETRRRVMADVLLEQERACETLGLRRRQQEIIGRLVAHLAPRGASARLAQTYLREGDLLTLLKRFDAADRALSTALRLSRELGDAALERHTLRSLGLLRWHAGRCDEALAITEHALAIDRACDDELSVAGDLSNLGNILNSMGQYAAALPRLEEALALPSLAQSPKKLAYALHGMANVHRAMGDPESALTCLRRADEIARTHLLPVQRSFHLTSMAHIDLQQGRIDRAIETYRDAIDLSRRARHADGLAQSLRMLGDVLFGLGQRDAALPYLQEAASLFAQLEDRPQEAEMWNRMARALEDTRRPAESADAWERARALCVQVGDTRGQLDALEGAARTRRQTNQSPDACIPAFEDALALASTLGEGKRALMLRNTLGILEWTSGRYADALAHYEAALRLVREQADRAQEALILNSLGVTLARLSRPEEARTALEESVALSRQTGERLLEAHALAALGQVCRAVECPDRAVHYYEQSLEIRRALGDRPGEGWMLHRIADARARQGDEPGARAAAAAAARIAVETGDAELVAACAHVHSSELRG